MTCACSRIQQTHGHCHGDRRTCDYPCRVVTKSKQPSCWQKATGQAPPQGGNQ